MSQDFDRLHSFDVDLARPLDVLHREGNLIEADQLLLAGVRDLYCCLGRDGNGSRQSLDRLARVGRLLDSDIDRLATAFSRTWNRPPDANELQAQIQDYIREEVLYRAALQLGLDKDDSIIRRRLRQKMEFLFEDTVPPPQEAELRAYFQSHIDKFRLAPLISFR